MMTAQENISLRELNTLGLSASARYCIEINTEDQLLEALAFAETRQLPWMVLGGGSNIILTTDFPGLVLKMALRGVSVKEEGGQLIVSAAAGENWHQLVEHCLANGYNGLENLAYIPGTVGAAPIQNIGAYGLELADIFHSLRGWDCEHRCWRSFDRDSCQFAYRDSIFKGRLKGRFIITEVSLALHKNAAVNCDYRALQDHLHQQQISQPSPQQLAAAVIRIRQSKLPDPAQLPNAGSFFKNPLVTGSQAEQLKNLYPGLPCYPQPDGRVKLAAGWLLEHAGWKGKRSGPVGMHAQQALVLINYAGACGADVLSLAREIQRDIKQQFKLDLTIEPAIY